ncbi:MAG: SUMF1/EgtB/PvdO family nonheme iron enzyme [Chloroflexi bacterium]|nr:SUMF1/EgtB/PvdO family nonheme iron enzyme [Chloroflexota bacterium]
MIPAGPFIYGPQECYERLEQCPPLRPRQVLWLDEFSMGVYPVTVAEWKQFLDETGYRWGGQWYTIVRGPRGFLRRYAPTADYPPALARHPIVDVTQSDAYAYCEWLSRRLNASCTLPTEEQWEKAARGTDGRTYPWGEAHPRPELRWQKKFPVGLATFFFSLLVKPKREWARSGWYWRVGATIPVGSIPQNVSPYGCWDMAGNIWEWTSSLYNPNLPGFHVVKGGSWGYSVHHTKLYVRSACSVTIPSAQYHAQGTGFRVAIVQRIACGATERV